MLAYWFYDRDPRDSVVRLRHGDGRVVRVGETLRVDGPIDPGSWGLHAGRTALDALWTGSGSGLALVRLGGPIVARGVLLAAAERTPLWMADVAPTLHAFACDVAEHALARVGAAAPEAARLAVVTKRRWIAGAASDAVLAAARRAALDAALALAGRHDTAAWATQAAADAAEADADFAAYRASWAAWRARVGASITAARVERAWHARRLHRLLRTAGLPDPAAVA
jgi:hypothetical protein